jgi:hypothetical protein
MLSSHKVHENSFVTDNKAVVLLSLKFLYRQFLLVRIISSGV